jgi:hypothetical protein
MNYRKQKKQWTRRAAWCAEALEGNPLNMVANQEYKFALRILASLKGLKKAINEHKRSKKAAKAA